LLWHAISPQPSRSLVLRRVWRTRRPAMVCRVCRGRSLVTSRPTLRAVRRPRRCGARVLGPRCADRRHHRSDAVDRRRGGHDHPGEAGRPRRGLLWARRRAGSGGSSSIGPCRCDRAGAYRSTPRSSARDGPHPDPRTGRRGLHGGSGGPRGARSWTAARSRPAAQQQRSERRSRPAGGARCGAPPGIGRGCARAAR
jgi:hypothetical protein